MVSLDSKIYVAGHHGLIGSALVRKLTSLGYKNILTAPRTELDLTDAQAVKNFFEKNKPEIVFLAAGRVGGILANIEYPGEFISQNLKIQIACMEGALQNDAKKFFFYASSCMYPKTCPQPMNEDALWGSKPEETSLSYAAAKLAGVQMALAFNQQYKKTQFIPVIPNNAYGPNDDFDPKTSHVLSALLRKFHEAKIQNKECVTLWGTGKPRREFIYSDDIADASLFLMNHPLEGVSLPINIGVGNDYSIKEMAENIAKVLDYHGTLAFDTSKPDGAMRKLLDSNKLLQLGWKPKISLEEGIQKTYAWLRENPEELK